MTSSNSDPLLKAAQDYLARGYQPVPVLHGQKRPITGGWQNQRLAESDLPSHFNGSGNIGLLLGAPSGDLVDVDLDCDEAIELADQYLPPTLAVTGRASAPRSHRWYLAAGVKTKRHKDPHNGDTMVELRGAGVQTLVGPSVHPSGEPYDVLEGEPARVDAAALAQAVAELAQAVVKARYGDEPKQPQRQAPSRPRSNDHDLTRATKYLDAMPPAISGQGGHDQTYAAATVMVHGFGLDSGNALTLLMERYNPRCEPPWTERELKHKVEDAASKPHDKAYRWLADSTIATWDERARRNGTVNGAGGGMAGSTRPGCGDELPEILIDTDEHRVVDETISALTGDPELFQRGSMLVRVLRDRQEGGAVVRPEGSAVIAPVPQANLRDRMTRFALFSKRTKQCDVVPAHPAQWLVAAVEARGQWHGVRPLRGISDAPILRPDGSIWQTRGYDAQTGVLFEPSGQFPAIHPEVNLDDASAAMDTLLEVVCDFKFETEAHQSAWLAALLTPLARFAFDGPAPLFLVDANVRGAGKGLLVQTIGRIALGREMAVGSYSHDTEEMRKKITVAAMAGDQMVLLDNLNGRFGNDALDRALTTTRWKDRVLGKSEQVDLPLLVTWFATGNNVQVAADTVRRIVHIRLDVLEERPEERTGFKHADLLAWIAGHRGDLLVAALTILSGFCRAGRPKQGLTPMGSFEGWSGLVREAVVWLGLPDPCLTRQGLEQSADTAHEALEGLLDAWSDFDENGNGLVLSEVIGRLYPRNTEPPMDEASVAMRGALDNLVNCRPGQNPTARQIGNKLRTFRRRIVNKMFLDTNPSEKRRSGAVWRLHTTGGGP